MNKKSDAAAKKAFVKELERRGFTAKIVASPADIIAMKDDQTWYYEIKMTKHTEDQPYFGAATITEWNQALLTPKNFRFVVVYTDDNEESFTFNEYTPQEFMAFSTIPPFKIFFNIPGKGSKTAAKSRKMTKRTAIRVTEDNLKCLSNFYKKLKED